jgi:hypothetical protein
MRWFGPRHGEERSVAMACSRLIADAEAFLSGNYADHLARQTEAVPGWARLNAFAHGDLRTIRRVRWPFGVRGPTALADRTDEAWKIAQRVLADQVLEIVGGDPVTLLRVQESVLVPLELLLMYERSLTAFELVQITRAALRWPDA